MAKKILTTIKLQAPGGQASPAPPVGPALGQHGINIMEFVKAFNAQTANDMGTTIPVRSVRYSILPALMSETAFPMSNVMVPALGLGILPWGPRMRPRRPTTGIMSGVAIATSKSVKFSFWTRSARSSAPTKSAPASSASRALSPLAKTAMRTSLPSPCGSAIVPRSCSSAWRTLSPVRMCTSTVSSNFARLASLTRRTASCGEYSRSRSTFARASAYARPCLATTPPPPPPSSARCPR